MANADPLKVEAVFCPRPGVTDAVMLTLPAGARVADALRASDIRRARDVIASDCR